MPGAFISMSVVSTYSGKRAFISFSIFFKSRRQLCICNLAQTCLSSVNSTGNLAQNALHFYRSGGKNDSFRMLKSSRQFLCVLAQFGLAMWGRRAEVPPGPFTSFTPTVSTSH